MDILQSAEDIPSTSPRSAEILENLHRRINSKRVDLENALREMKNGKRIKNEKVHRMALAAIFMEEVWGIIETQLKNASDTCGLPVDIYADNRKPYLHGMDAFLQDAKTPREIANVLNRGMQSVFITAAEAWSQERNDRLTNARNKRSEKDWKFEQYCRAAESPVHPLGPKNGRPVHQLIAGFGTACNQMWGFIDVIPHVFRKQFGRPITETEYVLAMRNTQKLLHQLANSHMNVFFMQGVRVDDRQNIILNPEKYHFSNEQTLVLELDESMAQKKPKVPAPSETVHTGCPAMVAEGTNGTLVGEMRNWNLAVAHQYYLPHYVRLQGQS